MLGQSNLTYMPTLSLYAQLLFTFMSMLCVRESGYCCQSLSVMRPLHEPGFYFLFLFFTLTLMSNFVLLTESLWDTE